MRFGGICLVIALSLGACSGDPKPKEPDPTASSAVPSPTVTPPEMPEQAKEDSLNGAAALVDYWIRVSNYAAATGDIEELDRLSADECRGCSNYLDLYRDTYRAGGYFKGAPWKIGDVGAGESGGSYFVTVEISYDEGKFKADAESPEQVTKPGESTISFAVTDRTVTQMGEGEVER